MFLFEELLTMSNFRTKPGFGQDPLIGIGNYQINLGNKR